MDDLSPLAKRAVSDMLTNAQSSAELHQAITEAVVWIEQHPTANWTPDHKPRTATITVALDESEEPQTIHEVARIALTCDDGPLAPQDFTNVRERTENLVATLEDARRENGNGHSMECGHCIDDAFGIAGEILDLAKKGANDG